MYLFHLYRACEDIEEARYVDSIFSLSRPGIGITILYAVVETIIFFGLIWLLEVSPLLVLGQVTVGMTLAGQDRGMQLKSTLFIHTYIIHSLDKDACICRRAIHVI